MRQEFSAFLWSRLTVYTARKGVFSTERAHLRRNPSRLCADAAAFEAGQIFDDFARDDESHNGRHKSVAARHLTALRTLSLGARRADAVRAAAYGHVVHGCDGQLFGVNHFQLAHARAFSARCA